MMAKVTYAEAPTASYTAREAEVANADWDKGCNRGGTNAPGIGVNIAGGEISGDPQQFTLKDQADAVRVPQISEVIGGLGLTTKAEYPSSGGISGKGTVPLAVGNVSAEGDGEVLATGNANLQTLAAGWVDVAV